MNGSLYVGLTIFRQRVDFVMLAGAGDVLCRTHFPASALGGAAIRSFLAGFQEPLRIAISGTEALAFALKMGNETRREIMVVFDGAQKQAVELAVYARRRL